LFSVEESSMKSTTKRWRQAAVAIIIIVAASWIGAPIIDEGKTQQISFDTDVNNIWNNGQSELFDDDVYCLAEAVYFEAGNQPVVGKVAVASVILNRVLAEEYPDTICDVVHQGPIRESWKKDGTFHPIKHKCQFSYWCDGRSDTPKFGPTWNDSLDIAGWITDRQRDVAVIDITDGATHYHASYVSPSWSHVMQKVVQIEAHLFYK
jgi:spore germination cell wall hydrolase CwlJ-like protein